MDLYLPADPHTFTHTHTQPRKLFISICMQIQEIQEIYNTYTYTHCGIVFYKIRKYIKIERIEKYTNLSMDEFSFVQNKILSNYLYYFIAKLLIRN